LFKRIGLGQGSCLAQGQEMAAWWVAGSASSLGEGRSGRGGDRGLFWARSATLRTSVSPRPRPAPPGAGLGSDDGGPNLWHWPGANRRGLEGGGVLRQPRCFGSAGPCWRREPCWSVSMACDESRGRVELTVLPARGCRRKRPRSQVVCQGRRFLAGPSATGSRRKNPDRADQLGVQGGHSHLGLRVAAKKGQPASFRGMVSAGPLVQGRRTARRGDGRNEVWRSAGRGACKPLVHSAPHRVTGRVGGAVGTRTCDLRRREGPGCRAGDGRLGAELTLSWVSCAHAAAAKKPGDWAATRVRTTWPANGWAGPQNPRMQIMFL